MNAYISEFIGTLIFVALGNAVIANVLLRRTKGQDSGWIVIATGWAMAIFVAGWIASASGAHLNPAVTIAMWSAGRLDAALVPGYILAQFAGAIAASVLVFLQFLPHWGATPDAGAKLACFSTGPAIRAPLSNLISELLATFFFVFGILMLVDSPWHAAAVTDEAMAASQHAAALPAGWAAFAIGCLLWVVALGPGGTTGFAINPARDLGPRIAHALLPIAGKGRSDWGYAWVPVVGPIAGGLLAVVVHRSMAGM